jgi:hypothetical protein
MNFKTLPTALQVACLQKTFEVYMYGIAMHIRDLKKYTHGYE